MLEMSKSTLQFIEMGYNVRNVKMEPDSLLKWVIMLEMSR